MKHVPSQTFQQARTTVYEKLIQKGATNKQSKDMEKSILEYTKDQCKKRNFDEIRWSDIRVRRLYIRKASMIMKNITNVLRMVESNEVDCLSVAELTHYKINPEIWRPIIEKMEKREICTMIADTEERYEGLLKCEQCSSMNTRYVTVQTRSADEPETVFATCMDCGSNWTMN
jgi:DNA-directed RNA polymerase subunit M/transcription elongation factor TFIIS